MKTDDLGEALGIYSLYGNIVPCKSIVNTDDWLTNFTEASDGKFRIVYCTKNLVNGKMYIGQHTTFNMDDGYLGSGKLLLQAIKKYGKHSFDTRFLCFCETQEDLDKAEIFWIAHFETIKMGYNILDGGKIDCTMEVRDSANSTRRKNIDSGQIVPWNKGKTGIYSKEVLERMSKIRLGTKQTEESNSKRSSTLMGRFASEETKAKMRESFKGRVITEETRKKISDKLKGNKQSAETLEKQRLKRIGSKHSDETKNKISEANRRRVVTDNQRRKLSEAHKGKVISEEMKQSIKDKWVNKPFHKCPYCGHKSKSVAPLNRFHFDNCKNKK